MVRGRVWRGDQREIEKDREHTHTEREHRDGVITLAVQQFDQEFSIFHRKILQRDSSGGRVSLLLLDNVVAHACCLVGLVVCGMLEC